MKQTIKYFLVHIDTKIFFIYLFYFIFITIRDMPKLQNCNIIYLVQTVNNIVVLMDPYWLYSSCDIVAGFLHSWCCIWVRKK